MKIPIPDDWNGTRWRCVQIEWPDSPQMLGVFLGFLSQMTRGRFWDEKTGIVIDAQAVGWQIWDRNFPLADCEGQPIDTTGGSGSGGGIVILGDDDMGQVVTEIKVEGGKLKVYYGHCCVDEFDLGTSIVSGAEAGLGDDPLNVDDDPDYVYSACGKANAIVEIVYAIVEAGWDEIDTLPFFWQIIPNIERAVGYDLDNPYLIDMMSNIVATNSAGWELADFMDSTDKQRIRAALVEMFADTPAGIPDSPTFEAVKSVFLNEVGSLWEPTARLMFSSAINALGRVDMDTVAKLGAGDTTADCGDVAGVFPGFGEGLTWSHIIDFRNSTLPAGTTLREDPDIDTHHTPGTGIWSDVGGSGDGTEIGVHIPIPGTPTGSITRVGLAMTTLGDDDLGSLNGALVRLNNPEDILMTMQALANQSGSNPAAVGSWQFQMVCSGAYAAGSPTELEIAFGAFHLPDEDPPDIPANSNIIIALAIGGTGDDPFPSLP